MSTEGLKEGSNVAFTVKAQEAQKVQEFRVEVENSTILLLFSPKVVGFYSHGLLYCADVNMSISMCCFSSRQYTAMEFIFSYSFI